MAPIAETSMKSQDASRPCSPCESDYVIKIYAPERSPATRSLNRGAEGTEGVIGGIAQTRHGRLDRDRNP